MTMTAPTNKLDGAMMTQLQQYVFLEVGDEQLASDEVWGGSKWVPSSPAYVGHKYQDGMPPIRRAIALLSASKPAAPIAAMSADECAQDVYKHGQSIGLFDIPKETANAICAGITSITGARVDWHYIAGRVHMKALAASPAAPAQSAEPVALTALRQLEDACDKIASLRTREQYLSMIDGGQQDALIELDNARMFARNALRGPAAPQPAQTAVVLDDEREHLRDVFRGLDSAIYSTKPYEAAQHANRLRNLVFEPNGLLERAASPQPAQTDRLLIWDAICSLSMRADELKASNTSPDGTWCDADEEATYDAEVTLIEQLRAFHGTLPASGGDQ
ncbi:hypothetical protein RI103_06845 [Paraburkholderia sp. FT54]|uniref:hypothetical protein n=1 Tax=Paraburkholderia sp. FT54 TaxID=3074437 RepID=UPI0028777603|nr:hypothetical protein [Paraburkholderia sp. FT54]WNC91063.1 hypothetical protein RI103_06845 [Paraburkholderia sp. FT54]